VITYHDPLCRYRLLSEAIKEIETLFSRITITRDDEQKRCAEIARVYASALTPNTNWACEEQEGYQNGCIDTATCITNAILGTDE
jgi:hypothetical protein